MFSLLAGGLIYYFGFDLVTMRGSGMDPTLSGGNMVLCVKQSLLDWLRGIVPEEFRQFGIDDVVLIRYEIESDDEEEPGREVRLIKRITAMDGDELDALVITDQPLTTGIYLKARVLGVMKFEDDGEVDDKIICVVDDDRNNGDAIKSLEDLPKRTIEQIEFHFNHYKDLKKPGTTHVKGFFGVEDATKVIEDAIARWQSAN